jgi:hypothetical protein
MFRSVLLSLALATFAHAQNPPGYTTAFYAAKDAGKPLVIFVACEGREVPGAQCLECTRYPGATQPVIVVGDPETLACKRLYPTATDADIRAAFPQRVQRGNVREYVSEGKVYREYYSVHSATNQATPAYSPPAYQHYYQPVYAATYASPSPTIGVYGGVQLGTYGNVYGGACVGGNCPAPGR